MKRVLCVMLGLCVASAAYAQETEKKETNEKFEAKQHGKEKVLEPL